MAFQIASFRTLQPPPTFFTHPCSRAWEITFNFSSVVANCINMLWALEHSTPPFSWTPGSQPSVLGCVTSALGSLARRVRILHGDSRIVKDGLSVDFLSKFLKFSWPSCLFWFNFWMDTVSSGCEMAGSMIRIGVVRRGVESMPISRSCLCQLQKLFTLVKLLPFY